jgi:hypothetical protein
MKRFVLFLITIPVLLFIWVSCEEVIVLDLKNTEPRIVIEASLNASNGDCIVTATKSFGFYETGEFTKVSGASVELINQSDQIISLQEMSPGTYTAANLKMTPGELIRLNIKVTSDEQYSAETRVPRYVPLDSLSFEPAIADPRQQDVDAIYMMNAKWKDPGYSFNFYRFKVTNNGKSYNKSFAITSNERCCGIVIELPIFYFLFALGDTVNLEFQSIDSASYTYFDQINDMMLPSFVSATPYNPTGNFNNRALGYFGIYYNQKFDMIVTKGPVNIYSR